MTQERARSLASGVLGAAGLIAALTLASRLAGFGRWLVQAWAVGATATGSAYASANTVPNVLYEVVAGGALAGTVVPLLAAPLAAGMREDVSRLASALATWVLTVLTPIALLVVALADPLADALLPGADPATSGLATMLLRVFAAQIPLYGLGVVLTGVLQAQRRFLWPALTPLLSTGVVVISYTVVGMLTAWTTPEPSEVTPAVAAWLAWGTTAGVAALSLPLLVPVARSGVRLRPTWRFPRGAGARARSLALAGLATVIAQQVHILVVLRAANAHGGAGAYPVFQYAQAVYALPFAVLAVPVATAVFPRVAEHLETGARVEGARLLAASTRAVLVAGVTGAALLVGLAPTATAVFALRGPMPGMTVAVDALAPGVVGYALIFHLTRALYAAGGGHGAVRGAATGWFVAAAAAWAAAAHLGGSHGATGVLLGIGAGTSLGMTLGAIVLVREIRAHVGSDALRGLGRTGLVALVGGGVGALLARLAVEHLLQVSSGLAAVLAWAALGGTLVLVSVLLALAVGDRSVLTTLRRRPVGA